MADVSKPMHLIRPGVTAPGASSTTSACNVKIHLSALLQILEIVSKQVISDKKRIIGTLLGYRSDDGSDFEVRDAFMVPCDEDGDSIAIQDQQHKDLYQLYKKAHPKESVLGWFGTGSQIDATTGLIHDFYSKGKDRAFPYPAIYLNLNFRNGDFITAPQISTYIGSNVGKVSSGTQNVGWKTQNVVPSYVFQPIPNKIITGTATEKLALKSLVQGEINQTSSNELQAADILSQIATIIASIDTLSQHIQKFDINDDKDLELLRLLSNNLSSKPQTLFDLEELKKHFAAYNQDVIMIEYLTKVVKEQIELSARLTATSESEKKSRD